MRAARIREWHDDDADGTADLLREIGLEIALAVREVGAMLINVGWEQALREPKTATRPPDANA